MNIQLLQSFIGHLRSNKLMDRSDIIRIVRAMEQLDRRVGQLALLRGVLTQEQVAKIVSAQTQFNKKFIEMAVEMGYISDSKGKDLLRLQQDGLFSFAQAAVVAHVKTLPEMITLLKPFIASNVAKPEEEIEERKEEKAETEAETATATAK